MMVTKGSASNLGYASGLKAANSKRFTYGEEGIADAEHSTAKAVRASRVLTYVVLPAVAVALVVGAASFVITKMEGKMRQSPQTQIQKVDGVHIRK